MINEQRTAVFQQFGRTYRSFLGAFEGLVGQPAPRWRILFQLYQHSGSQSQKQLAETLRIDPGALTRQLKVLEGLGWVSRSTDERDNRVTNVVLAPPGAAIVKDALPRRELFIETITAGLSEAAMADLVKGLALLEQAIVDAQHRLPAVPSSGGPNLEAGSNDKVDADPNP